MKLPEPVSVDQYPYGIHSYYTEAQMREMYQQGLEDAVYLASGYASHLSWEEEFIERLDALKEQAN